MHQENLASAQSPTGVQDTKFIKRGCWCFIREVDDFPQKLYGNFGHYITKRSD